MSDAALLLEPPPRFVTDSQGKSTAVTLGTAAYVTLLVRANVTDPALWPTGIEHGASALERVRRIESDAIEQYGEFDWEKLPEALQDEYDRLCVLLDQLHWQPHAR